MPYNPNNVNIDNSDYESVVRFLIGDTNTSAYELVSNEITALYSETSADDTQAIRNIATAVKCAQALHTKYAKQATFSSAGTSVQLTERAKYWETVIDRLIQRLFAVIGQSQMTYVYRPISYC